MAERRWLYVLVGIFKLLGLIGLIACSNLSFLFDVTITNWWVALGMTVFAGCSCFGSLLGIGVGRTMSTSLSVPSGNIVYSMSLTIAGTSGMLIAAVLEFFLPVTVLMIILDLIMFGITLIGDVWSIHLYTPYAKDFD